MSADPSTTHHFGSYTEARQQFRAVLDAANRGPLTTVQRDDERFVVMAAARFREEVAALRPAKAVVVPEGGGFAVLIPGLPMHGDGDTFDDAVDDAIDGLRDYAEDWDLRLHLAPNHRQHRSVVALVQLSTDDQLYEWLVGGPRPVPAHSAEAPSPSTSGGSSASSTR